MFFKESFEAPGTLSLLAGIDLLTGKVYALVRDRHRSREFTEFLKLLDAAYPASTAIKLILDNHSAHISRETRAWLDTRPAPPRAPWWEVLGVSQEASLEEINQHYRQAIRMYHPDKVAEMAPEIIALAERRTQELNAAFSQAKRVRSGAAK